MAEGMAFDQLNPPVKVTNPGAPSGFQEYPRHLHRMNGEYVVVTNDVDKEAKLADGWFLTPDAAKAAAAPKRKGRDE